MSDPFVAEIRIVGFNFAPKGYAFCNGQIMPISQNTALFSLLGTMYGGDGKSTFALPNFQGRAPMFYGQGPGLSLRDIGEEAGQEVVTLNTQEMPLHNHNLMGVSDVGDINTVQNMQFARSSGAAVYNTASSPLVALNAQAVGLQGGSQSHNNMQPYLALNFIIALQGVFPPRS